VWPPSPFAHPTGSFRERQTLPVSSPTDSPAVQVCVNVAWLPLIAGALKQLWLETTWDAPTLADLLAVQAQVTALIDLFNLALHTAGECGSTEPPFICSYGFATAVSGSPWLEAPRGDLVSPTAHFQTGVGWSTVSSYEPGGDQYWQCVTVGVDFPGPVSLNIVQVGLVGWSKGSDYAGNLAANVSGIEVFSLGVQVDQHFIGSPDIPDGSSILAHDFGGITADRVVVTFLAGVTHTGPADGLGFIAGIIATGSAPDPACP
jgi:hypothetical protein